MKKVRIKVRTFWYKVTTSDFYRFLNRYKTKQVNFVSDGVSFEGKGYVLD